MLRNNLKSNNNKSKRKSGFFKSDNSSPSFSPLQDCENYSNQHPYNNLRQSSRITSNLCISPIHESLQPVPETNNRNNNDGAYYSTVRSNSERSISSNLSFLSKNSSVLDLIYQDLEESANTDDEEEEEAEGETTTKIQENFSPLASKALFEIKNDSRDKGRWRLLNDESDPIIDYYPEFSHDAQYPKIKRIELDFN